MCVLLLLLFYYYIIVAYRGLIVTYTVENDFFGFPKVKWVQYTGEMGNCTSS